MLYAFYLLIEFTDGHILWLCTMLYVLEYNQKAIKNDNEKAQQWLAGGQLGQMALKNKAM